MIKLISSNRIRMRCFRKWIFSTSFLSRYWSWMVRPEQSVALSVRIEIVLGSGFPSRRVPIPSTDESNILILQKKNTFLFCEWIDGTRHTHLAWREGIRSLLYYIPNLHSIISFHHPSDPFHVGLFPISCNYCQIPPQHSTVTTTTTTNHIYDIPLHPPVVTSMSIVTLTLPLTNLT